MKELKPCPPDKRIRIPCGYNEGSYATPGINCFFYCSDWDKSREGACENGIPCNKNCLEWGRNWEAKKPKARKMAIEKHKSEIAAWNKRVTAQTRRRA